MNESNKSPAFKLTGIRINPISNLQILKYLCEWIDSQSFEHDIVVTNTHVMMESRNNPDLAKAVEEATLVVPDGMPLVVISRWRGFPLRERADGPGLMAKALSQEPYRSWKHYFYGSTDEMLSGIRAKYPEANIVGEYAPPFRPLSAEEEEQITKEIKDKAPDVLWVGLGCPKQEIWMHEHKGKLNVPVMLGVGQAFDILAGTKKRAPKWMQNAGLEWFYRLIQEPRRLWKRYLINNPWFMWLVLKEQAEIFLSGSSES